jgi:Ca2+-transporting ATPase
MVTDVLPALALALEPAAPDMMKRPPRDPREGLITGGFASLLAWQGAMLAAVALIAFGLGLRWHGMEPEGVRRATTMAFLTLAFAQVAHAFNARSQRQSIFTTRLFTNAWLWAAVLVCLLLQVVAVTVPFLRRVLQTVPPLASEWLVIAICSLAPVMIVELVKLTRRRGPPAATVQTKA